MIIMISLFIISRLFEDALSGLYNLPPESSTRDDFEYLIRLINPIPGITGNFTQQTGLNSI